MKTSIHYYLFILCLVIIIAFRGCHPVPATTIVKNINVKCQEIKITYKSVVEGSSVVKSYYKQRCI